MPSLVRYVCHCLPMFTYIWSIYWLARPWGMREHVMATHFLIDYQVPHSLKHMGVSKNRGTLRWFVWKALSKWMSWGYHYFRKHPHVNISHRDIGCFWDLVTLCRLHRVWSNVIQSHHCVVCVIVWDRFKIRILWKSKTIKIIVIGILTYKPFLKPLVFTKKMHSK